MPDWVVLAAMGVVIGVAVAAPVGAVGVLVIRRALQDRPWAGFVAGLGAATGDALFAAVAGLGLTAMTHVLETWQRPLRIGGGLVLVAIGLVLLSRMRRPHGVEVRAGQSPGPMMGPGQAFATALALTLGNPATAFSFIAIFAATGLSQPDPDLTDVAVLVVAVFAGSAAWFAALSAGAWKVSQRWGERAARVFDAVAALLLVALGVLALVLPGS
ncbi:MAG: LysE family transporter [Xanthomonadales bacterium]|nr:LysE family transporter [Xanthomonadales bacterium]